MLLLAPGCVDVLSGRFVTPEDDSAQLVRQAEVIERDELCTLRLREGIVNLTTCVVCGIIAGMTLSA
jgi:hypothetical protein